MGKNSGLSLIRALSTQETWTLSTLKEAVTEAVLGQQVGVKISAFKRGRIGDLVESFEMGRLKNSVRWHPRGGVFRY